VPNAERERRARPAEPPAVARALDDRRRPGGERGGPPAVARALDIIEAETAVLVRHFELLNRRWPIDDLDRAEYLLLRTLAGGGPMDINTLAAALGVDPSTAGRQVGAARAAGLVAGEPDPADRRRTVLTPTPEGLRRMAAARRLRTCNIADLLAGWSEADLRTLGEMFGRYNRAVADRYLTATPLTNT
jgi:DNA-binding MarR family transcriptional regulator